MAHLKYVEDNEQAREGKVLRPDLRHDHGSVEKGAAGPSMREGSLTV